MYSHAGPARSPGSVLHATRLLDQVRERIRFLHQGPRTEAPCLLRIRAVIRSHGPRPILRHLTRAVHAAGAVASSPGALASRGGAR